MPRTVYIDVVDDEAEEIETTMIDPGGKIVLTVRPPARDRGPAYVKIQPETGEPYTFRDWHFYALFDQKLVGDDPAGGGYREATDRERYLGQWVTD